MREGFLAVVVVLLVVPILLLSWPVPVRVDGQYFPSEGGVAQQAHAVVKALRNAEKPHGAQVLLGTPQRVVVGRLVPVMLAMSEQQQHQDRLYIHTLHTYVHTYVQYIMIVLGAGGCLLYTSPSPRDRG